MTGAAAEGGLAVGQMPETLPGDTEVGVSQVTSFRAPDTATVLLFITATSRWRIGRVEGGIMLAGYVGYCVWLGMNSAA